MGELRRLFDNFKSKYQRAIVRDEALGNEPESFHKEKKAHEAWAESKVAEQEFLEALAKVDA